MKTNFYSLICILCIFASAQKSRAQTADSTQSAIYDAIAILNAKHGLNAILISQPRGFDIINPLNGQKMAANQTVTPVGFTEEKAPGTSAAIIKSILKRNAGLPGNATDQQLATAYQTNPYLSSLFNANTMNFVAAQGAFTYTVGGFDVPKTSGGTLSDLGGNLVNGTADFLIQRANEELSVAIFKKLQDFIDRYPEFNVLFPRTKKLIQPIAPYDYAKTLKALKAAVQEDLDNLPANIPQLYSLSRYQLLNKQVPELTLAFASAELFTQLHGKSSLSKSLHDIDTAAFLTERNNYASFIRLLSICSNSFRKKLLSDKEDGDYFYFSIADIDAITRKNLAIETELGQLYLGLLYQQVRSISIWDQNGQHPVTDLMSRWTNSTANILNQLVTSSGQLESLGQQLLKIKLIDEGLTSAGQPAFSAERFELYNKLVITSMQLFQPFITVESGNNAPGRRQLSGICTYWPAFSTNGIQLVKDISQKNYNLGIQDLSTMLKSLSDYLEATQKNKTASQTLTNNLENQSSNTQASLDAAIAAKKLELSNLVAPANATQEIKAAVAGETQLAKQSLEQLNKDLASNQWESENTRKLVFSLSKILSYFDLLASISQAGNSEEVEKILETYALPAGSSRVKKETAFNISVNAYVGGFFGRTNTNGEGFTNKYGLTAPIGFSTSIGFAKAGSLSLFTGIFDIGGVIRYKLDNDGAYQQDINFAGLVSPSAQLAYGLPFYLPLTLGAGCQWTTPATAGTNKIDLRPHFNVFLAVDIPLFNLAVVKKK